MRLSDLNSATKYPSIPTYHAMEKGRLVDRVAVDFGGPVYVTEKIDGTNGRIVLLPGGDYFLGSREELIYAKGDRIESPELGIVPALKPIAERLCVEASPHHGAAVYFGEVYGGDLPAARQYTASKALGFRLFDVVVYDEAGLAAALCMEPSRRASWREAGGQPFLAVSGLRALADTVCLPLVPSVVSIDASALPSALADGWEFLADRVLSTATRCPLDGGPIWLGRAEGLVLRSADRRSIAKMRVEDYGKALGRPWR